MDSELSSPYAISKSSYCAHPDGTICPFSSEAEFQATRCRKSLNMFLNFLLIALYPTAAYLPASNGVHGSVVTLSSLRPRALHTFSKFCTRAAKASIKAQATNANKGIFSETPQYENNGGFLYRRSFLSQAEFESLLSESRSLHSQMGKEGDDAFAKNRLGLHLDRNALIFKTFSSDIMASRIGKLVGAELKTMSDVNLIQYQRGSYMDQHRDDADFFPPEITGIFTLENSADSYTEITSDTGEFERILTEPNSLLIIGGGSGGPLHRVAPVSIGERTIVCCNWVEKDADRMDGEADDYSYEGSKWPKQERPRPKSRRKR